MARITGEFTQGVVNDDKEVGASIMSNISL